MTLRIPKNTTWKYHENHRELLQMACNVVNLRDMEPTPNDDGIDVLRKALLKAGCIDDNP